eukprot:1230975-Amphidinium_carterae.1
MALRSPQRCLHGAVLRKAYKAMWLYLTRPRAQTAKVRAHALALSLRNPRPPRAPQKMKVFKK